MQMSDRSLKQAVEDELSWEPSINSGHIGVTAENGVVTLTGHVGSYIEKLNAERAARQVKGVRAIAQEIEIRLPNEKKTSDDQIAKRALDIIAWDSTIPKDKLQVKVESGFVTLSGQVDWHYQRTDAEFSVRKLEGIKGLSNQIQVKPRVRASDVKSLIESALKRNAELEAGSIKVSVVNGRVTLDGKVKAWYERELAERMAWSAPGVVSVEDHISIV
jgi:osmotically-inducible protein OsmY